MGIVGYNLQGLPVTGGGGGALDPLLDPLNLGPTSVL